MDIKVMSDGDSDESGWIWEDTSSSSMDELVDALILLTGEERIG